MFLTADKERVGRGTKEEADGERGQLEDSEYFQGAGSGTAPGSSSPDTRLHRYPRGEASQLGRQSVVQYAAFERGPHDAHLMRKTVMRGAPSDLARLEAKLKLERDARHTLNRKVQQADRR